ncbi:hypothetical protein PENSTE_c050G10111 [Penicillium steckii]|uniref:Carboxylesterase type B domain-containing protein n=1 Tax=Penicillium steckii TaxID=303698 RepID=A0A1V6SIY8_9EURO|nr:hypothetical protein PENSTE_c050G10111 [Penicillium steckii]
MLIKRLNAQHKKRSPTIGSATMYASGRYRRPTRLAERTLFSVEKTPHTPGPQGLGASFAGTSALPRVCLTSNNGLWDQRVALAWLRKHISGFNVYSENITLIEQSTGAA